MSFMDQLGKIVSKPGTQATPQQGHLAYLDRLEQSKAEAKQRITSLFAELGRAYYKSHADDQQTEYEAQLAAIRDVYADIAQCETQAGEVAAGKRCPACGAQLAEGSLFCNICGTKLRDLPRNAEKEEMNLCPQCHTVISPDDVFCTSCGADLRDNGSKECTP